MRKMLFAIFALISLNIYGTTYKVGESRIYKSPNELYVANVISDNDTIEIDVANYLGNAALAIWNKNNLVIKGVGGKPHLLADGKYIQGKGIWVISGNNVIVENIEFSGSKVPDQNGAGIRAEGIGITIRNCYFHDNENGILTSNPYDGDVLIEYCEFARNGYGDGYTHNLYVGHVNSLTFKFNYSHHAKVGQNLKSRAQNNFILYNRIMDEETGNSSRLIDLPNGGFALVMGNLLMQGNNAENNNMVGYGPEGLSNNGPHEFYFINNTCVNKRTASCRFLTIKDGTDKVEVINNVLAGRGTVSEGAAVTLKNTLVMEDIETLNFVDEANYDYHLQANSPAIDYGRAVADIGNISLTPINSYAHPAKKEERTIVGNGIDAGAYEYGVALNLIEKKYSNFEFVVYPNPIKDIGVVSFDLPEMKKVELTLFDLNGRKIETVFSGIKEAGSHQFEIDVKQLKSGLYTLELKSKKYSLSKKIIVLSN